MVGEGKTVLDSEVDVVDERAVLTTGANSGIGLATVIEVAQRGFHSIGSVRSEAKAGVVQQAARTLASRSRPSCSTSAIRRSAKKW